MGGGGGFDGGATDEVNKAEDNLPYGVIPPHIKEEYVYTILYLVDIKETYFH